MEGLERCGGGGGVKEMGRGWRGKREVEGVEGLERGGGGGGVREMWRGWRG